MSWAVRRPIDNFGPTGTLGMLYWFIYNTVGVSEKIVLVFLFFFTHNIIDRFLIVYLYLDVLHNTPRVNATWIEQLKESGAVNSLRLPIGDFQFIPYGPYLVRHYYRTVKSIRLSVDPPPSSKLHATPLHFCFFSFLAFLFWLFCFVFCNTTFPPKRMDVGMVD